MSDAFATSLGDEGRLLECLFRNRKAEMTGVFDEGGLIIGYDIVAPQGVVTFGMPRRPHLGCLNLAKNSTSISGKLTFWHGAMSAAEIVAGLYAALRIDPLDNYQRNEVDMLLKQPATPYREARILDVYRDTAFEKAIRTIILAGPCDLAEYIVALRGTHPDEAQLLIARDFRPLLDKSLPGWEIRKPIFGKRATGNLDKRFYTDGLTRCFVPPFEAAVLLAELTRAAQNLAAHSKRALSVTNQWLSRKKLHCELNDNKDQHVESRGISIACAMGMEPLFDQKASKSGKTAGAARKAVRNQIEKFEKVAADAKALDELTSQTAQQIVDFPVVDPAISLQKLMPQTDAVRAWGLTVREHVAWALALLYDDARLVADSNDHIPDRPKRAYDIANMKHGEAMWCLAAEWIRSSSEEAAMAFARPAQLAQLERSPKGTRKKDSGANLPKSAPVQAEDRDGRGKTMLEKGRSIRKSDVLNLPSSSAIYDFRFWLLPEDGPHQRLKIFTKPMLPVNYGAGLAEKVGGLPKNIVVKQLGARISQQSNRCSTADKRALAMTNASAHDAMLTPLGPSLSGMYFVLRSNAQHLHRGQSNEIRKAAPENSNPLLREVNGPAKSLFTARLQTSVSAMALTQSLIAQENKRRPLAPSAAQSR